jgi:hypothetical protein
MYSKYLNSSSEYDNIQFKSKLEVRIYKALKTYFKDVKYENHKYELLPPVRCFNVPFYNRIGKTFKQDSRILQSITYTPDFSFFFNNILVLVEAKGKENDVFPYKRQLFRRLLEESTEPVIYFEVRTVREVHMLYKVLQGESEDTFRLRVLIGREIGSLFNKYNKMLENHDWQGLEKLLKKAAVTNEEVYNLLEKFMKNEATH